jgi:crooked neck
VVPHKTFTFAKIWLFYAQFEVRRLDLSTARKALGRALGVCPKVKLFKGYIELELQVKLGLALSIFEQCNIYSCVNSIAAAFSMKSSLNIHRRMSLLG